MGVHMKVHSLSPGVQCHHDAWDKGGFYNHLTSVQIPGLDGAEGTADRIGLTAAVGAGAAIAAHAAVTAIKQARSKTANDQVSTVEK